MASCSSEQADVELATRIVAAARGPPRAKAALQRAHEMHARFRPDTGISPEANLNRARRFYSQFLPGGRLHEDPMYDRILLREQMLRSWDERGRVLLEDSSDSDDEAPRMDTEEPMGEMEPERGPEVAEPETEAEIGGCPDLEADESEQSAEEEEEPEATPTRRVYQRLPMRWVEVPQSSSQYGGRREHEDRPWVWVKH